MNLKTPIVFAIFHVTTCICSCYGGSLAYGTPLYTGEPKTGTYNSAKDYWKAKRDALKKGKRGYSSASSFKKDNNDEKDMNPKKPAEESSPSSGNTGVDNQTKEPAQENGPPESSSAPTSSDPASSVSTSPPVVPPRENYHGQSITMEDFELHSCQTILNKLCGSDYSEDGSSPEEGFSPEGLVSYVYSNLGYPTKPLSPQEHWNLTGLYTGNSLSDSRTGDLLFFKLFSKTEGKAKITVTICYDSIEMVYPSFTSQKVIKKHYDNNFWRQRFIGSKRILVGE